MRNFLKINLFALLNDPPVNEEYESHSFAGRTVLPFRLHLARGPQFAHFRFKTMKRFWNSLKVRNVKVEQRASPTQQAFVKQAQLQMFEDEIALSFLTIFLSLTFFLQIEPFCCKIFL